MQSNSSTLETYHGSSAKQKLHFVSSVALLLEQLTNKSTIFSQEVDKQFVDALTDLLVEASKETAEYIKNKPFH